MFLYYKCYNVRCYLMQYELSIALEPLNGKSKSHPISVKYLLLLSFSWLNLLFSRLCCTDVNLMFPPGIPECYVALKSNSIHCYFALAEHKAMFLLC